MSTTTPARILAVANQKGGVGKTTLTFHLAREAVQMGQRVLLVDADPQGNLTRSATAEPIDPTVHATLADVLGERAPRPLADVIVPGRWDGLDVVPATLALGVVENELTSGPVGRELHLADALAPVRDRYDLVMIDCRPTIGQLTINALTAADGLVIPVEPSLYALDGFDGLLNTVKAVRRSLNPKLRIVGIVLTKYDGRRSEHKYRAAELQQIATERDLPLLDPPIPLRSVIDEAVGAGAGLDQWGSRTAKDLAALHRQHLATLLGSLT